jgi:hypothetical protein
MTIFVRKHFPLLWFTVIAVVAWGLWGVGVGHAQDDYEIDDDVLTADELDAEYEFDDAHDQAQHQFESVDSRVTQQQTTIDALEQRELELRYELELLREEAAVKAAEDEARRIALGEALKNYGKENDF